MAFTGVWSLVITNFNRNLWIRRYSYYDMANSRIGPQFYKFLLRFYNNLRLVLALEIYLCHIFGKALLNESIHNLLL